MKSDVNNCQYEVFKAILEVWLLTETFSGTKPIHLFLELKRRFDSQKLNQNTRKFLADQAKILLDWQRFDIHDLDSDNPSLNPHENKRWSMGDSSIDLFLKESCKSFEKCRVKNSARRNSLQKKTDHLNIAMRKVSHNHDREERLLRKELDAIQRGRPDKSESPRGLSQSRKISRTKPEVAGGRSWGSGSSGRGRQESREFEDLHMVTSTGKLQPTRLLSIVKDSSRLNKAHKAESTAKILSPVNDDGRAINRSKRSDERIGKLDHQYQ